MNDPARPPSEIEDGLADDLLVRDAQADPRRFAPLYDRYVDLVYRFCRRRLLTEAAAEDATSAVFVKALAALPRFNHRQNSFRAWLFTIAFNVVMDHKRTRQRRPEEPLDDTTPVRRAEPSPEEVFLANETRRSVSAAIAVLTAEQREVVELRLAGLNGHEISTVTGRSHGAVRTAQHRALLRLRELLRDEIEPVPAREPAERRGNQP